MDYLTGPVARCHADPVAHCHECIVREQRIATLERDLATAQERIAELEQSNFDMWMTGRENEKS